LKKNPFWSLFATNRSGPCPEKKDRAKNLNKIFPEREHDRSASVPVSAHATMGDIVRIAKFAFLALMFFAANADAAELPAQDDPGKATQQTDAEIQSQGSNTPEVALPADQTPESTQDEVPVNRTDKAVAAHKSNYFAINNLPWNGAAQVKFQISMKFRVLDPKIYLGKYNLFPAYVGYTQKSLWNEGQSAMPFEETNYNPEFFLDYPVNRQVLDFFFGPVYLRNVVVSPMEHESNGLAGDQSRRWIRQYAQVFFSLEPEEKLETPNSFMSDKALLYVKLWYASGYSDEEVYLESVGKQERFLDYMGKGEVGLSIRNFLWSGRLRNCQLDVKTPIIRQNRKPSFRWEFRQELPNMNFALYLQYWYGYGETLSRFDQFGRRGFAGLSFSY
jgi:phospholipase A1